MSKPKYWSFIVLFGCFTAYIVNPLSFSLSNVDWMLQGDLAQSLIGWEFYRASPPEMPITRIGHLFPNTGFSVVQTDTIPWLSVIFRAALNFFEIHQEVHFIGLWLILCWILQCVYGALIAKLFELKTETHLLLIFMMGFSPLLLQRFGHFSLMAHWITLAAIYESCRSVKGHPSSLGRVCFFAALAALSIGIHPYHFAITAPIFAMATLYSGTSPRNKSIALGLMVTLTFVSIKILGFNTVKQAQASDFGACNTDLLGIFNSFGNSLFVPGLRAFWCQPEGYSYFGLGFLILLISCRKTLIQHIKSLWQNPKSKYFMLLGLAYILYSLASPIRFGGNPILYLPIYKLIEPIPSIFRSSGRWIWPIYYLVMIGGVYCLDRSSLRYKKLLISALVAFQFIEFTPMFRLFKPAPEPSKPLLTKIAAQLPTPSPEVTKMHLYPNVVSVGCGIDDKKWDTRDWAMIMIALARKGWQIDSGLGARMSPDMVEECQEANKQTPRLQFPLITKVLPEGQFDSEELWPGIFLIKGGK